jgi:hypothetical protein
MTGRLEYQPQLDVVVCGLCRREMELPAKLGRDPESLMMWIEAKWPGHQASPSHQAAVKEQQRRQVLLRWRKESRDVIDRGLHTIHTRVQATAGG